MNLAATGVYESASFDPPFADFRFMSRCRFPRVSSAVLVLALAACADGRSDVADADSALARDLALVQASAGAQPIFQDTALTAAARPARQDVRTPPAKPRARPERPRVERETTPVTRPVSRPRRREPRRPQTVVEAPPRAEEPASRAEPIDRRGEGARGSIGAGSVLAATSNARVCSRTNKPGDRVVATVSETVRGSNGAEIPAGSKVVLEVVSIDPAEPPAEGHVALRVTSVDVEEESYPASGSSVASGRFEAAPGSRTTASDRNKVIGGAIAGAILGQVIGKDTRSTVIGAAAGAAAGTAAARMGERGESCLAAGTPLRITIDERIVMR